MLLCDGNSQILEETILYAALDVLAKCLGSKFLDKIRLALAGIRNTGVKRAGNAEGGKPQRRNLPGRFR
jgi:hypothetical protein